jgi:hypothetical protein
VTQTPDTTIETPTFDEWAIVEMLGHRRVAGRLREVQIAGHGFLRMDIPGTDTEPGATQFISPTSIYAMHPTDEATATAAAARWRPEPVQRWQLEPAPARPVEDFGYADGDNW